MTDLSPAASAVMKALLEAKFECKIKLNDYPRMTWILGRELAAALRAAADQVVPEYETTPGGSKIWPSEPVLSIRTEFLAIAAELEAIANV